MSRIDPETLARQEDRFAHAFAAHDVALARALYHPAVVYVSPTVRLFDWPSVIEGVDRTLEFIALTIRGVEAIDYRLLEWAVVPAGDAAFVRIRFDFTREYVVIYRYRGGLIGRQELYYDPSGRLEVLQAGG
jgi:hypothetical protein